MSDLFAYRAGMAPDDAVSLPLYMLDASGLLKWQDEAGAQWGAWLAAHNFAAQLGALLVLPAPEGGLAGAIIGLGEPKRAPFSMLKALDHLPKGDWHLAHDLPQDLAHEVMLGWCLSRYRFTRYRAVAQSGDTRLKCPRNVDARRISAMVEGEFLTRDLINTPANDLGPAALETAFLSLADTMGARAQVISGDALLESGFRMIHAVGRAAAEAPRILDLRWGETGPQLTLVGKGVCFDTGGLDIKPSANMLLMKKDMGGAATVMGLALMIARLNINLRLRVLVPAVENAISADAMRPKDILTSRKGLTVEVNNTDAEGRLILADALDYASEDEAATIISMATLTGAARVALGPDIAPYFCDDLQMTRAIEAGGLSGLDPVWRLPFWPGYERMIEAEIADLDNAPAGGFAGAITAALFLRRFVKTPRYAHFDIYGHAQSHGPARRQGGLGQGARAVLEALPQMFGHDL